MYVSAPPPPVLTLAVPAEISMHHGTESQPLRLAPYQIVQATVAEGGLEKVVLNVRQQKFSADTEVPLRTGQQLNLQVVSTRPKVHLRIMEAAELRHLFRLLNTLGSSEKLAGMLKAVMDSCGGAEDAQTGAGAGDGGTGGREAPDVFRSVLSGLYRLLRAGPENLSGKELSGLSGRLGLDMEALFAGGKTGEAAQGLKPALLSLAGAADKSGQPLPDVLEQALEQVRLFQLCRYRLAQENVIFLPLPFSFLEQGYLLAEREKPGEDEGGPGGEREKEGGGSWKMSINLKLSSMGCLEIKLLFEGSGLRMRVLCESDQTAEMLFNALPDLRKRLTTVSLKGYSVGTGAEEPVTKLVKRLAPEGEHFMEAQV